MVKRNVCKTYLKGFKPLKFNGLVLFEYLRFGANRLPRWELALFERGRVVSATLPRRFFIGGIMNDKLNEVYNCLKAMDMMLYMHAHKPRAVVGFQTTKEMAEYYRQFLHIILPEEYRYNQEEAEEEEEK